jgi:hypothetical protein
MGIAGNIAFHGAKAESFGRIVTGGFHPPVVKNQRFTAAAFKKKLAIIGAIRGPAQQFKGFLKINGLLERAER